jgi:hypothetical protein
MLQPLLLRNEEYITPLPPALSLLVADSFPVSYANLTVSYCRAPCYAWCNVSNVGVAVVNPAILSLPAWDAIHVSVAVPVWAQFGTCAHPPHAWVIKCRARIATCIRASAPFDFAVARLPIQCLPTRWPLLGRCCAAAIPQVTMSDVVLKSAWGAPVNVTSLLQDGTLPSLAAAASLLYPVSQSKGVASLTLEVQSPLHPCDGHSCCPLAKILASCW